MRRGTKEEVEKFPQGIADPANGFVFCLENLALKKLSNQVYDHIKKTFNKELVKKEL